ncbi:MAG TPA: M15 family metallopeptidase [Candidatus Tumulicola sp.]
MLLDGDSTNGDPTDAGTPDDQSTAGAPTDQSDQSNATDGGVTSDGGASSTSSVDMNSDAGVDSTASDGGDSSTTQMDGGTSSSSSSSDSSDASTSSSSSSTDYTAIVPIPSGINNGLTFAAQATMLTAFGNPGTPDPGCGPSSAALAPLMKTANVGPFRVTGFGAAVDALTRVFTAVQAAKPDLYAVLGTQGMLCVRYVRGSTTNFSNHAWGTAIDMTIGGVLTARGSTDMTQGLVDLAPFMAAESFFWGAGFSPTVDGMHFEASNELISQWKANGTIP